MLHAPHITKGEMHHGMGGRQQAQAFIWPAPIPTRPLSAEDAETHMDPIPMILSIYIYLSRLLATSSLPWYVMESIYMDLQSSQS